MEKWLNDVVHWYKKTSLLLYSINRVYFQEFRTPQLPNMVQIFEQAVTKFKDNKLFGTKNKEKTAYDWVTYK